MISWYPVMSLMYTMYFPPYVQRQQFAMYWVIGGKYYCWVPESSAVTSGTRIMYREEEDCCGVMQYHYHPQHQASWVASISNGELCLSSEKNHTGGGYDGRRITLDTDCGTHEFRGETDPVTRVKKMVLIEDESYCISFDEQGYNVLKKCEETKIPYDGEQCYMFFLNSIYSVWHPPQASTVVHGNETLGASLYTNPAMTLSIATSIEKTLIEATSSTQQPITTSIVTSIQSTSSMEQTTHETTFIESTFIESTYIETTYISDETTTLYHEGTSTLSDEKTTTIFNEETSTVAPTTSLVAPTTTSISTSIASSSSVMETSSYSTSIASTSLFTSPVNIPVTSSINEPITTSQYEVTTTQPLTTSVMTTTKFEHQTFSVSSSMQPLSSSVSSSSLSTMYTTSSVSTSMAISSSVTLALSTSSVAETTTLFQTSSHSPSTYVITSFQTTSHMSSSSSSRILSTSLLTTSQMSSSSNSKEMTTYIDVTTSFPLMMTSSISTQLANYEKPQILTAHNCYGPCNYIGGRCDWCGPNGWCCQSNETRCPVEMRFASLDFHVCILKFGVKTEAKTEIVNYANCFGPCGNVGGRCTWCGVDGYCCSRTDEHCDEFLRTVATENHVCIRDRRDKVQVVSQANCFGNCGYKEGRCQWCGPHGHCCQKNGTGCSQDLNAVALNYPVCVRDDQAKPKIISYTNCFIQCGEKGGRCNWCGPNGYCCRQNDPDKGCPEYLSKVAVGYHVCVQPVSSVIEGNPHIISTENCLGQCGNVGGRCSWCGPNGYCCKKNGTDCTVELRAVSLDYYACVRGKQAKPKIMSSENCLQHCGGVGGRCDWCGQPNAFCCSKSERLCNNAVREIALDYHVCIALETQVQAKAQLISNDPCLTHCNGTGGRCTWCGPDGYCCKRNGGECTKEMADVALSYHACVHVIDENIHKGYPSIISYHNCWSPCGEKGGRCDWCGPRGYCCRNNGSDCSAELRAVGIYFHTCIRARTETPQIISTENCFPHCGNTSGLCTWCGDNGYCCQRGDTGCSLALRSIALHYHICIRAGGETPRLLSTENCFTPCGNRGGLCKWCGRNGYCCRKHGFECDIRLRSVALDYHVCIQDRSGRLKGTLIGTQKCWSRCGERGGRCNWCGPNGYCCHRDMPDCPDFLRTAALDYYVCVGIRENSTQTGSSQLISTEKCFPHCSNNGGLCNWCGPNGHCCQNNGTGCSQDLAVHALDYHVCVRKKEDKFSILSTENCYKPCGGKGGRCTWCGPRGYCCSQSEVNCGHTMRQSALNYHVCVAVQTDDIISKENCFDHCGNVSGACVWCGPRGFCCNRNESGCSLDLRSKITLEYHVCVRGQPVQPQIVSTEKCLPHCNNIGGPCNWCGPNGYCCNRTGSECPLELTAIALDYHVCVRGVGTNSTSTGLKSRPYIMSTESCYMPCGNRSGPCNWCGPGGYCCVKDGTGCPSSLQAVALDYHVCMGTAVWSMKANSTGSRLISTMDCFDSCGERGGRCTWCGPNGYCCKRNGASCSRDLQEAARDYHVCVRGKPTGPQIVSSVNCYQHCGQKGGRCDWCGVDGYCCRKSGNECSSHLRAVALFYHVCVRSKENQHGKAAIISTEKCLHHCNNKGGPCNWCGPNGHCCKQGGTDCEKRLSSVALAYHVCVRTDDNGEKARPYVISTANCFNNCGQEGGRCDWCGPEGYCCKKNGTGCSQELHDAALDYHVCLLASTAKPGIVSSENCLSRCGGNGGRCDWCGPNGYCCKQDGTECPEDLRRVALDYNVCVRGSGTKERKTPYIVSSENCFSHCEEKGGICNWCGPNGYCCKKDGAECDAYLNNVALDYHVCVRAHASSNNAKPYLISSDPCWNECKKKGGRCDWCGPNGYCCKQDGVDCASDLNDVALNYHVCVRAATEYLASWAQWSNCDVTCGIGTQKRFSQCDIDVKKDRLECGKDFSETQNCSTTACPVNGGFSDWTSWSNCTKPCGIGRTRRYRLCDNPPPQGDGKGCMGMNEVKKLCNVEFCKIVGSWGPWSGYSECNKPCHNGTIERRRNCILGTNKNYDRRACPGIHLQTLPCHGQKCQGKRVLITLNMLTDGIINVTKGNQYTTKERQILESYLKENINDFYSVEDGKVLLLNIDELSWKSNRSAKAVVEVLYERLDAIQLIDLQKSITKMNMINNIQVTSQYKIEILNSSINHSSIHPKLHGESETEVVVSWAKNARHNPNMTYVVWYKKSEESSSEYKSIGGRCCNITLTDLMPGKGYVISLVPYHGNDVGVPTEEIQFFTKIGKPSFPPRDVDATFNARDLFASWDVAEQDLLNIVGFQITVRHVKLEAVSRLVTTDQNNIVIDRLNSSTGYFLLICAFSETGCGPEARVFAKSPDAAPSVPPPNITINSVFAQKELFITWQHIPFEHRNGIITHYEVMLEEIHHDDAREKETRLEQIHGNHTSTTIANLKISQKYRVQMWAVNQYMSGEKSRDIVAETSSCPPIVYTNYMVLPPYVCAPNIEANTFDKARCLFVSILHETFREMCGGPSKVKIDLLNNGIGNWARKKHLLLMTQDIPLGIGISYPFIAVSERLEVNGGVFVPLLPHPGIIIITKKESVDAVVSNTFSTLLRCWPVVLCITLLGVLAGVIFWLLEDNTYREGRLRHPMSGISTGIWWAFIASTTLGYGDKIPVTTYGRLFATVWIIIGIVLTSICTAVLTSSLNAIYAKDDLRIYGKKVGAMPGSYAIKVAIRRNAIISPDANFTNIDELVDALRKRKVSHILVDIYSAMDSSLFKIPNPDLIYSDVIKDSESYGFVVSQNLGTIADKIYSYIISQQDEITNFLGRYANQTLKHEKQSETTVSLFHSETPSFTTAVQTLLIMLACALLLGLLHMYCDKIKRANRVNPNYQFMKRYDDLLNLMEDTKIKAGEKLLKIKELETPPTYAQIMKFNAMGSGALRNHFKGNAQEDHAIHIPEDYFFLPAIESFQMQSKRVLHDRHFVPDWFLKRKTDNNLFGKEKTQYEL